MSTIIRDGYKLKPGIDPFDFITRVREHMDPARDTADAKLLAELYAEKVDQAWFAGKPIEAEAGYTAWRTWHLEQSKMSPMERRHDPNEFGVQIGKDPLSGGYYLLAIVYKDDLRDAFEEMVEIEEYGYWNSTDSYPEWVTREEWEVREALWNRVLSRRGRSNMLTFTLRHASDASVRGLVDGLTEASSPVFDQLPSNRERAKNIALDAYAGHLARECGMDIMDAVNFLIFGRSTKPSVVIDVAAAHLPTITPELLTKGSEGAVIDAGYTEAMRAACEKLAELDKDKLAR